MPGDSDSVILILAAAPKEAESLALGLGALSFPHPEWRAIPIAPGVDLARTGIGKSNAAGAAALLLDPARHRAVLSIGIAGALPCSGHEPALGSCILATTSVFADEGLRTPEAFIDCPGMGFPLGPIQGCGVDADADVARRIAEGVGRPPGLLRGPIATVSTCSGTDGAAQDIARRTGAIGEAMEGASVGLVAARLGVPFAEVRVISNTTGDRAAQVWDLPGALTALRAIIGPIVTGLGHPLRHVQ